MISPCQVPYYFNKIFPVKGNIYSFQGRGSAIFGAITWLTAMLFPSEWVLLLEAFVITHFLTVSKLAIGFCFSVSSFTSPVATKLASRHVQSHLPVSVSPVPRHLSLLLEVQKIPSFLSKILFCITPLPTDTLQFRSSQMFPVTHHVNLGILRHALRQALPLAGLECSLPMVSTRWNVHFKRFYSNSKHFLSFLNVPYLSFHAESIMCSPLFSLSTLCLSPRLTTLHFTLFCLTLHLLTFEAYDNWD